MTDDRRSPSGRRSRGARVRSCVVDLFFILITVIGVIAILAVGGMVHFR